MSLPEDFTTENGEECLLQKSMYGLEQAPKVWHDKLSKGLATIGFDPIHAMESMFVRRQGHLPSFIIVYVDDTIIMSASHSTADESVSKLKQLKANHVRSWMNRLLHSTNGYRLRSYGIRQSRTSI